MPHTPAALSHHTNYKPENNKPMSASHVLKTPSFSGKFTRANFYKGNIVSNPPQLHAPEPNLYRAITHTPSLSQRIHIYTQNTYTRGRVHTAIYMYSMSTAIELLSATGAGLARSGAHGGEWERETVRRINARAPPIHPRTSQRHTHASVHMRMYSDGEGERVSGISAVIHYSVQSCRAYCWPGICMVVVFRLLLLLLYSVVFLLGKLLQ